MPIAAVPAKGSSDVDSAVQLGRSPACEDLVAAGWRLVDRARFEIFELGRQSEA
jgi:hypothetical protein